MTDVLELVIAGNNELLELNPPNNLQTRKKHCKP